MASTHRCRVLSDALCLRCGSNAVGSQGGHSVFMSPFWNFSRSPPSGFNTSFRFDVYSRTFPSCQPSLFAVPGPLWALARAVTEAYNILIQSPTVLLSERGHPPVGGLSRSVVGDLSPHGVYPALGVFCLSTGCHCTCCDHSAPLVMDQA